MMEPELMQQLRVDDPMEEPELNLDGLQISSIQVLLEPPVANEAAEDDEDDDTFYSPLDHFQNLVRLSMSSAQCQSLEAFPHLPRLRSLILSDNQLSQTFNALADANLQSLVLLDLSANKISDVSVLEPLDALGNLQHLLLAENSLAEEENYRDAVFEVLPQLITVDGLDRDGTEIEVDDEVLSSGDEEAQYGEDPESQSDSELEDQENRPPMAGGKTSSHPHQIDDDEEDDDELEEEDEEEDEEDEEFGEVEQRQPNKHLQRQPEQQSQEIGSGSEDDDDDEDDEEDEEDEEDDEGDDEDDGGEGPGLVYLLTDDIPDENDDEFEPGNEVEEDSEIESSDEDEFGSSNSRTGSATAARSAGATNNGSNHHSSSNNGSSNQTNGHPLKRPRSPAGDFDHGHAAAGFDVDGDDDATNGFGMASFDGPATFDDEGVHESKRSRT
ncbi:hypothetical protein BGZ98_000180 [Dissophora globulifera]|nr:hypothetical protein BGZ98_000180 [Dissophora globulifera]